MRETNEGLPVDSGSGLPPTGEGAPRLGVLGTLVWDTILDRDVRREPVEEWGGIAYGLEASTAALPKPWRIRPFLKVGEDLADRAFRFLRSLPRVDVEPGVRVVPFPNNRVELRYENQERKTERITGGLPAWTRDELEGIIDGVDAIYVNFITGGELELATAQWLRETFDGPLYTDLHSLFLGISSQGFRFPRELPGWGAWLRAFDAVQMNEKEFELLGRSWGDPWRLAADVVGPELKLIAVTLGDRGAAYVAAPEFEPDPRKWAGIRGGIGARGTARSARVRLEEDPRTGDPTGCGDVWGATFFARLLAGDDLEEAMGYANRMAGRNVAHRGARGLHHHLRGELGV